MSLWIRSYINFHFSSVFRYILIHRHAMKQAVSRAGNTTNKGPLMILTQVKRRIMWSLSLPTCPHFFFTWLIAKQFWEKGEDLQYNKVPVKLDGWVEDRDALKCLDNRENMSNFIMSMSVSTRLRTNHGVFCCFSGGAEQKTIGKCGGIAGGSC